MYQVNINTMSYAIKIALIRQNSRSPGKADLAPSINTRISKNPSRIKLGAVDLTALEIT